jgi:hypothetical protein
VDYLIGSIPGGLLSGPDFVRIIGSMDLAYRTPGAPTLKIMKVREVVN